MHHPLTLAKTGEDEHQSNISMQKSNKDGLSPGVAKYPNPTHPRHVPSDTVSQSATVSICPLCCTWFGY